MAEKWASLLLNTRRIGNEKRAPRSLSSVVLQLIFVIVVCSPASKAFLFRIRVEIKRADLMPYIEKQKTGSGCNEKTYYTKASRVIRQRRK